MADWRTDRVGAALRGENPTVLRRLRAGFAVIGDVQHFPGYCVLITDTPGVDQLGDLPVESQELFLADAALLARAVSAACRATQPGFRRINVEVQGNTDAFLHAHVTPRYEWEDETLRRWPSALTHWEGKVGPDDALGPRHDALRAALVDAIDAELAALAR